MYRRGTGGRTEVSKGHTEGECLGQELNPDLQVPACAVSARLLPTRRQKIVSLSEKRGDAHVYAGLMACSSPETCAPVTERSAFFPLGACVHLPAGRRSQADLRRPSPRAASRGKDQVSPSGGYAQQPCLCPIAAQKNPLARAQLHCAPQELAINETRFSPHFAGLECGSPVCQAGHLPTQL